MSPYKRLLFWNNSELCWPRFRNFYVYFYFSFHFSPFYYRFLLLSRSASCCSLVKSWLSFIHFQNTEEEGAEARQQVGTCLLIISRLAVMMQTPEAHFIDWNSRFQKHINTSLLNRRRDWANLSCFSAVLSGSSGSEVFWKGSNFLPDKQLENSLKHVTAVHLPVNTVQIISLSLFDI